MKRGKTLWMVVTLAVVGAAALSLPYATRGQNSPVATGNKGPDFVSFPGAAASLVAGEKLRTYLVNIGTDPVQVVVSVFDSNGTVVQQETVTVAPGAMQTSEFSCAGLPSTTPGLAPGLTPGTPGACPGAPGAPTAADGSTAVRTEVKRKQDKQDFLVVKLETVVVTSALVCDTSGPTPTSCGGAKGTTGPTALPRLAANH